MRNNMKNHLNCKYNNGSVSIQCLYFQFEVCGLKFFQRSSRTNNSKCKKINEISFIFDGNQQTQ